MTYRQKSLIDNGLKFDFPFKNEKEQNLNKFIIKVNNKTKFYQQFLRKSA